MHQRVQQLRQQMQYDDEHVKRLRQQAQLDAEPSDVGHDEDKEEHTHRPKKVDKKGVPTLSLRPPEELPPRKSKQMAWKLYCK